MTLILTSTGQPIEIEEVHEAGFYARVDGHARFIPSEAVTHPAPAVPTCPHCKSSLARSYDRRGVYLECQQVQCHYEATAPSLFDARI